MTDCAFHTSAARQRGGQSHVSRKCVSLSVDTSSGGEESCGTLRQIHSASNPSRHHEKTQNTNVKVAVVLIQVCQSEGSQPASGISSGGFCDSETFISTK